MISLISLQKDSEHYNWTLGTRVAQSPLLLATYPKGVLRLICSPHPVITGKIIPLKRVKNTFYYNVMWEILDQGEIQME